MSSREGAQGAGAGCRDLRKIVVSPGRIALSGIVVARQGCIEGAENTAETASRIDILEERAKSVSRVEEGGERAAGVSEGAEMHSAVQRIGGADEEVVRDGFRRSVTSRAARGGRLANPLKVSL